MNTLHIYEFDAELNIHHACEIHIVSTIAIVGIA